MTLNVTEPKPESVPPPLRPWVAQLLRSDYRLERLGLDEDLILLLNNHEEIYSIPDLAKILRITSDARLSVEVGDESPLGYRSGKAICEALADAGLPMVGCSEAGER